MKVFQKILLITLPLIILPALVVGVVSHHVARKGLWEVSEKVLDSHLQRAVAVCRDVLDRPAGAGESRRGEALERLDGMRFGRTGFVMALDDTGRVLAHPDRSVVGQNVGEDTWFSSMREAGSGAISFFWRGRPRRAVFTAMPPVGWRLAAVQDEEELSEPISELGVLTLLVVLSGFALATLVLVRLTRFVTDPIHPLIRGVDRIRRGRLDTHIPVSTGDEIGVLSGAFNAMAVQIQELVHDLETKNVELRQEVAERRLAEAKYRSIFDNALEGIFQSTPEGRYLSVNPAMARILGYDSPEQIISEVTRIGPQTYVDPARREELVRRVLTEGKVVGFEAELIRRDGERIWGMLSARLVRDAAGEIAYLEGMLEDATDRKRAEEELALLNRRLERLVQERTADLTDKKRELEIANERLRKLDELKSAFLSTVSHDLRTPLTSILGFTKMVRKLFARHFNPLASEGDTLAAKAEQIEDNLAIVEQEGERLTRLINDFLDLSKIESGRIEWNDQPLELGVLVERAAATVRGQAAINPKVELVASVQPDLPEVHADPDRISQVLINLLNNAVKFTDAGRIEIGAETATGGLVRLWVEDTGPGIPVDERELVFDKFHQVSLGDTLRSSSKGTGLGLAICRQIVDHYGGRIWVESSEGRGSTFIVELPAGAT